MMSFYQPSVEKSTGSSDLAVTARLCEAEGAEVLFGPERAIYALMSPDDPTEEKALPGYAAMNAIPLRWIEPEDVSRVVLWLASDDGRYTTGAAVKADLGATA